MEVARAPLIAMSLLYTLVGIGLLYGGGDLLVHYATRLGRLYGLSPLIIGLTVVAFGTSSPELATSLAAVLRGAPAVALGNVVGTNIAHLARILGLTATVFPLTVQARFLRRDGLVMLFASALLVPFGLDGVYSRVEGMILFALLLAYLGVLLRAREAPAVEDEFAQEYGATGGPSAAVSWLGVLGGLVLLVAGGEFMVTGGTGLARMLGVSERVIGLTVVAFGTSLPELATSVAAAVRREPDIVLGNVVGSNIFNVLAVLGTTAMVHPVAVAWSAMQVDIVIMLAVAVLTILALGRTLRVSRAEGGLLLASYTAYIIYVAS